MAVYTEVSDEELANFIASYGLGELLSFKGIAEGVENTNYIIHASKGPFILTLYEKRVNPADLPFFVGLMEHLATRGIDCPQPVRNREGVALDCVVTVAAKRPFAGTISVSLDDADPIDLGDIAARAIFVVPRS